MSHKGIWIRAKELLDTAAPRRIVEAAAKEGYTDLFVQVVVGGYAYYDSRILPRSERLDSLPGYDPLWAVCEEAKARDIRVHAWVNTNLVWSLDSLPKKREHVYWEHPDWFLTDHLGRSMRECPVGELREMGADGAFLDPSRPEVRDWVARVCLEIAENYPVDGIHLDFIRYPGEHWGFPQTPLGMAAAGLPSWKAKPASLARAKPHEIWLAWRLWLLNLERRRAVQEEVEAVAGALRLHAPGVLLSAALWADLPLARWKVAQDWARWGSLLDFGVIMAYTPRADRFVHLVREGKRVLGDGLWVGVGHLWKDTLTPWRQESLAAELGVRGVVHFDWGRVFGDDPRWPVPKRPRRPRFRWMLNLGPQRDSIPDGFWEFWREVAERGETPRDWQERGKEVGAWLGWVDSRFAPDSLFVPKARIVAIDGDTDTVYAWDEGKLARETFRLRVGGRAEVRLGGRRRLLRVLSEEPERWVRPEELPRDMWGRALIWTLRAFLSR